MSRMIIRFTAIPAIGLGVGWILNACRVHLIGNHFDPNDNWSLIGISLFLIGCFFIKDINTTNMSFTYQYLLDSHQRHRDKTDADRIVSSGLPICLMFIFHGSCFILYAARSMFFR